MKYFYNLAVLFSPITMSFPALQPDTSYTHSWEMFSKIFFLAASIQKENILHVVSGDHEIKKYGLLAKEIWISYQKIETYHDVNKLQILSNTIFAISIDELSSNIDTDTLNTWYTLQVGKQYIMEEVLKSLQSLSYDFNEYDKPGSYKRKGDIISLTYPEGSTLSIHFWWDEVESLEIDGKKIEEVTLHSLEKINWEQTWSSLLWEYIAEKSIFTLFDGLEFHHNYENILSLWVRNSSFDILASTDSKKKHIDLWIESLSIWNLEELKEYFWNTKNIVTLYTRHEKTLDQFLSENNFSHIKLVSVKTHLCTSFSLLKWQKNHIYIWDDILSKIFIKKRVKKKLSADIDLLLKIQSGDFVVHIDHGIWVFKWIIKKALWTVEKEYMEISYEKQDKLFVPITEVHRVSKYVWSENPKLTPLSGKIWEKKMKKVHEDIREIAEGILQSFAERKLRNSGKNILDMSKISVFQESFGYIYTEDQVSSIEDILGDMQSDKNMDRLIVWDVWFWKTEIAFNAAYMALLAKKQVLLISPLVVLAHEHYDKALKRFIDFWYNVEVLTRLQSQKHATRVLKWLADGSVDMVVGTHRLLSDKLVCKNLWLMIVDEEHKFWVVDKEKIKKMRSDIDILSLSATPIPRSLNLALSWVRDISLLKTPPSGRKSIETSVIRFNEQVIIEAWKREFERDGQIFFVHNRVTNIEAVKKKLEALFPKKKVVITHGQLPGEELENRIIDFKNRKYDILLSTTVIENGIDFSNVNTIFINECQSFGISQIHQLRGRVWRSDVQWYCYLLYKKEHLDGEAAKRIQTIVDYSYLGAGFELAMKDLEIRWWWDILWVRQSGQSKEIWVSLFLKMLEEKIEELKQEQEHTSSYKKKVEKIKCTIDLMMTAGIPDSYFLNETDKLNFYREIEMIESIEDLNYLKNSFFENNFEDIPQEAHNLFLLLETQILARSYKIQNIKKIGINYQIDFHTSTSLEELKWFLSLDKEVKFAVVDITRIRTATKGFENDRFFIEYLLRLIQGNVWNKKLKLVKKRSK